MAVFERVIYSLCLLNVVMCLVMAPFQLFYITIILQWQEECSLILLLCSIWCSAMFTGVAVLHLYIVYNKHGEHWSGLRKNMRFLVTVIFVLFGQMMGLLFARFRLNKGTESKFKSAMNYYYNTSDSSRSYIDSTQTAGRCCGYYNRFDWGSATLPPSCCVSKEDLCYVREGYTRGCQDYFDNLIKNGTEVPLLVSMILLLTTLTVYVIVMTYLQFSGVALYEEIPETTYEDSVTEGTHQSWRSPRQSVNDGDIVPAHQSHSRPV